MMKRPRNCLLVLVALVGCTKDPGSPAGSRVVLRENLGIDLAQVSAFAAVAGTNPAHQLRRDRLSPMDGELDAGAGAGPQLYALTLAGETLEVKLVEAETPDAPGAVSQPGVIAVYPTASWVLFSAPAFCLDPPRASGSAGPRCIGCSLIAARRADGALYCAALTSSDWNGRHVEETIRSNAAGDILYTVGGIVDQQGMTAEESIRLYKITLGGADGPSAAPAYDSPLRPHQFEVNAAGDLYVGYPLSAMDSTLRTEIRPADGGGAVTMQEQQGRVVAGTVGAADENSFYVWTGEGLGSFDWTTFTFVTKNGASFVETTHTLTLANADTYGGLFRLADGIYMFGNRDMTLLRVIADGALVATPTPIPLVGVDRIPNFPGAMGIVPVAGRWVFIAATGAGYKFVRHDGIAQQDIPFDANLDIREFTVSTDGAIDFLAVRLDTQEKVRGAVAAGATAVTTVSAGVLDPAQVVVFTRID